MAINKTELPSHTSSKSVLALVGAKTITNASAYKHGSVTVLEILYSDASTVFIKHGPNDALEIGGTLEMGTGTKVSW